MEPMMEALIQGLDAMGLHYETCADPLGAAFGISAHNGHFDVRIALQPQASTCVIVSRLPFFAPSQRRPAMAEMLTRINYALALGCFEMDFSDGEITFRIGIDVEDDGLTPNMIRNLLRPAIAAPDHFLGAISAVAFTDVAPAAALSSGGLVGAAQRLAAMMANIGLSIDPQERLN